MRNLLDREDYFQSAKCIGKNAENETDGEWILVKNEPDTSGDGSRWCKKWEEFMDVKIQSQMSCSVQGCDTPMTLHQKCGAHLRVIDKRCSELYDKVCIAPICKEDNHCTNTSPFYVRKSRLVIKDKLE